MNFGANSLDLVAIGGRAYRVVDQQPVCVVALSAPAIADAWRRSGVICGLDLAPVDGGAPVRALLLADGVVSVVGAGAPARAVNPADAAGDVAAMWYGRPAETVTEVVSERHFHSHLADLGLLIELEIFPEDVDWNKPQIVPLQFEAGENVRLASNEARNQLFLVGAVSLSDKTLTRLGLSDAEKNKELMALGKVNLIAYRAAKHYTKFKPADWGHSFAERFGFLPTLVYDARNNELQLAGGSYTIEPEGITN